MIVGSVPLQVIVLRTLARERVALATQLSVLVGLAGLALIVIPGIDGSSSAIGLALMVGATVSWSLGSFFAHRLPLPDGRLRRCDVGDAVRRVLPARARDVTGELGDVDPGAFSLESIAAWLYLGLAGTLIGFTAYAWLLRNAPISKVVTHQYVNPLVAIVARRRSARRADHADHRLRRRADRRLGLRRRAPGEPDRQAPVGRVRRRAKQSGRSGRLRAVAVGGTAARAGGRRVRLEVVHETRLRLDSPQPGFDGRIVRELDAGVARDVGVGVEADVGDGVVGSEEEVVRAEVPLEDVERVPADLLPALDEQPRGPSARPVRIQKRPVPMFGSSRFCSKKSHCAARARPSLSPGRSGVPSAR